MTLFASRLPLQTCRILRRRQQNTIVRLPVKRSMGGGAHYMQVSETHTLWGEVIGAAAWLWVFHRARHDLPVVLGWRHAFEHADGDHHHHHDETATETRQEGWDQFSAKAMQPREDDDDDDDDEEDDDE